MERVLVVESSCGAELGDARLDTRQIPAVVDGRVVDQTHLLLEARHVVVHQQIGGVLP